MFSSRKCKYSSKEIRTKEYDELAKQLLRMAKDKKVERQMRAILFRGGFGKFATNTRLTSNNYPQTERRRRVGYAYLLATNPELLDILIQNGINLFHGTNANALPNILKYGMQSVKEILNNDISLTSGEFLRSFDSEIFGMDMKRVPYLRNFISFTDDIDLAVEYARSPKDFGVLIGISSKSLKQLKTLYVKSDLAEVGIVDNIPLKHIKFIGVPEDKVQFVRKLVDNDETIVAPISMDERFYYLSQHNYSTIISFDAEKAEKLVAQTQQVARKDFNSKEMADMSRQRHFSAMRHIGEMIKNKERERRDDARNK